MTPLDKDQERFLLHHWQQFCSRLSIHPPKTSAYWSEFEECYQESQRFYHGFGHLYDMLQNLKNDFPLFSDNVSIQCAVWFHDLVYNTHAQDNEEKSAEKAIQFLSANHQGASIQTEVASLILATKKHSNLDKNGDVSVFLDIDLAILGSAREIYASYTQKIRKEYEWVEPKLYYTARSKVLQRFLQRDCIYFTPQYRETKESIARENLIWEHESISFLLEKLQHKKND